MALLVSAALAAPWLSDSVARPGEERRAVGGPEKFVTEHVGAVRWVYPRSAESDVEELKEVRGEAWQRITAELGGAIADETEVRVALNPDEMQELAPEGARLPTYAIGVAFPEQGLILLTLTAPRTWKLVDLETVFRHELSHLALYRAVGGRRVPRWFSEGVAIHQAEEHSMERLRTLWEGSVQERLVPMERLSASFPAHHHKVNTAYAQSADFVGYMLEGKDNQRRFRELIGNLREGESFEDAVFGAFQVPLGYLEREWRAGLQRRFGRLPLLLTGIGSVWILATVLLVVAYVKTRRKQRETRERWEREEAAREEETRRARKRKAEKQREARRRAEERKAETDPARAAYEPAQKPKITDKGGVPVIEYEGRNHTLH
jgi:hypothetical protein